MKYWALLLVTTALAQAPSRPPAGEPQTLLVSVTNKAGQYVPNLKETDFIIEENGKPQPIASFSTESDRPVSLGILIDKSTSMRLPVAAQGGERVSAALLAANGAAKVILKLMKPKDEYMLMTFDDVFNVKQGFTSDAKKMTEVLTKNLAVGGSTRLYHAISDALKETSKKAKNRRRAVVVITDVHDTSGDKIEDLQAFLRAQEVPVYTFGMRWNAWGVPGEDAETAQSPYEEAVLRMIAGESGGYSMVVDIPNLLTDYTITRMADFISAIAVDLRGQYTVTYNSSTPETSRAIRIRTTSPELQVRFMRDSADKPAAKK